MEPKFTPGEKAMAFITAWIIGFGTASGVAIFASGKVNWQGMAGAAIAGLITAAKDYRSLTRLPTVNGTGNTDQITKP